MTEPEVRRVFVEAVAAPVVEVAAGSVQGPAGEPGEPGPPGEAAALEFSFPVPTATWTAVHGLNYPVVPLPLDSAGEGISGFRFSYPSAGSVTVQFDEPVSGVLRLR